MYPVAMGTDRDEVRSAASALREAASAFSRALGETLTVAGAAAGRELADELKQATRELNDATVAIGFEFGGESRRSPKAERTRAELLAAARTVFAQKGYEGASVGDIAAAAGYTKGAVYANFGSKEELFLELARELTADDATLKDSDATPDLHEVFATRAATDARTTQVLLALELYLYALRHPESRPDLAPILAAAYDGIAALVHRWRTGSAGEPTQEDRDVALGLVAVHSLSSLIDPLLPGEGQAAASAARLFERLLAG